jgi:hypothetical protein
MTQRVTEHMALNITVPPAVYNEISARAEKDCITKAAVTRQILKQWIEKLDPKERISGGNNG